MNISTSTIQAKPTFKFDGITEQICSSIAQGKLKPGDRLPLRTELAQQFNTSRVTVQKSFNDLIRDGFVVSKGKLGTFVANNPPCLNQYGLVLPYSPTHPYWNGYYDALIQSLHELNEILDNQIQVYYGIDKPTDENYAVLYEDVKANRLAGLMFAETPHKLIVSGLMNEQSIPMVAVMYGESFPGLEHLLSCGFDPPSAYELACKILKQQGCKRIGFIMLANARQTFESIIQPILANNGLKYDPILSQSAHMEFPDEAGHVAQLLMALPPETRPDGLYICDDNLVSAVYRGLINAKVHVEEDLKIVSHCNFPIMPEKVLPATNVGFDIRQLLSTCLKRLEAKRNGDQSMEYIKIKAICSDHHTTKKELPS
ncbi:MAG TPA: hypothetical protein DCM28_16895 [Phycisphaerales bacterium]|nr:hypothetical protein [Phycisphaerales bacterium]HCD31490.1 hypothetical protein [Phycisphaerales bacterium]|tara:strand:- start:466 stop:1578 length:1113 start_codon:yes stop_codon:yes gene_type:complete